ncbi:hypothetical protein KKF55_01905 [Patescibacteria group bacterium]|nr:hypothetical protein [Patescibacteria group bacterium]
MTTFTALLSRSWRFFLQSKVPIAIGALLFTAIIMLSDGFFSQQEDRVTRQMMLRLGISDARFEELDKRMEKGDKTAFDEMLGEMELVGKMFEEMPEDAQLAFLTDWGKKMTFGLLPMMFLMGIMTIFIYFISSTFYYVLVIHKIRDPLMAVRSAIPKVISLFGVGVWMMLRSFMWVPGLNIFTGIYYLPRMMFSGVICVKEDLGVLDSVNASMERTKGKWLAIAIQYIMLFAVFVAASAIFAMLTGFAGPLKNFLLTFFGQLLFAFAIIFTVFYAEQFSKSVKSKVPPLRRNSGQAQSAQSRGTLPIATKHRR